MTEGGEALVYGLDEHLPALAPDVFVAPSAVVIGRVRIGRGSSVWYGSVLRGDEDDIVLGEETNVQDGCVLHADAGYPAVLGDRVTVGHRAVVHGARIDDDVLVGMGAVLLNGVRVGSHSVVAAGAVVTSGTEVPPGSLVAGVPGKVRRETGQEEREMIARASAAYVRRADRHRRGIHRLPGPGSTPGPGA